MRLTRKKLVVATAVVALGGGGVVLSTAVATTPASASVKAGSYTITNAGSALCLDLPGSGRASGVGLDLRACTGAANQVWTLTTVSTGYTITSVVSGLCLGIAGGSTSAGKAVQQQTCSGAADQDWTLNSGGSAYRLANVNSSRCMNTYKNAMLVGTPVVQNSCDGVATKSWTLTLASGSTPTPSATATPASTASSSASASASTSASASVGASSTPSSAGVSLSGITGDSRTVTEPVIPGVCRTLTASLTASNRAFSSAAETNAPDTARIQSALNACAGTGKAVELTASGGNGAFLSGPLTLGKGVTLLINTGTTLYGSRNPAAYQVSGKPTCGTLASSEGGCAALISVTGAGSAIEGVRGSNGSQGTIDGRGDQTILGQSTTWWGLATAAKNADKNQQNPRMIQAVHADDFTLYDVNLVNSPNFHVSYQNGDGFTVWGVRIKTPANARNTDGIDPAGATDVTIDDSYIQDGDDGIAIKGANASSNITVENSHFYGTHGISIGSETNGGVTNVLFANNTVSGSDSSGITSSSNNGIRIKSDSSRGGKVSRIGYVDTCLTGVKDLMVFDTHYSSSTGSLIPYFTGIVVDGLKSVNSVSGSSSVLGGYSSTYPLGLALEYVSLDATSSSAQYAAVSTYGTNLGISGTGVSVTKLGSATGSVPGCSFPTYPAL